MATARLVYMFTQTNMYNRLLLATREAGSWKSKQENNSISNKGNMWNGHWNLQQTIMNMSRTNWPIFSWNYCKQTLFKAKKVMVVLTIIWRAACLPATQRRLATNLEWLSAEHQESDVITSPVQKQRRYVNWETSSKKVPTLYRSRRDNQEGGQASAQQQRDVI